MYGKLIHVLWTLRYCQQISLAQTDRIYPWLDSNSNQLGCMLDGSSLEYRKFVGKCVFIIFSEGYINFWYSNKITNSKFWSTN